MNMNILFVCKHNAFRSKIAESFFNKLNKNRNIKVKSAGIMRGMRISKYIIETAKNFGIKIKGKPRGISSELLKWQDMIVIVADDVPPEIFYYRMKYGKKLIVWKIPDTESDNVEEIKRIIFEIKLKIQGLIKDFM